MNAFPAAGSAFGVEGLLANGWEWTSDRFAPFPGFRAFPLLPRLFRELLRWNALCDERRLAAHRSGMLRRSFRNWFQPHYQYVYAGFRCAGK